MRILISQMRRSDLVRAAIMGLLWAALGFGLTHLLEEGLHVSPFWADVFENLAVGLGAGFVFWSHESYRRQISQRRASAVSELNHHVRNALQMISYSRYAPEEKQLRIVDEATVRIDAVLREITDHDGIGL